MTFLEVILNEILGFGIGVCIGLTGVGGGVLVLTSLTAVLGVSYSAAIGTANLYSFITKVFASYDHIRLKNVHWRTAILFLVGAVPGSLGVSLWINHAIRAQSGNADGMAALQSRLGTVLTVVVVVAAVAVLHSLVKAWRRPPREARLREAAHNTPLQTVLGLVGGLVVGALIGGTSMGGGVIIVPILLALFALDPKQTVGTSIVITVVLALTTSVVYGSSGEIRWLTALVMGAASIPGAWLGTRLLSKLPNRTVHAMLAGLVVLAACLMVAGEVWH